MKNILAVVLGLALINGAAYAAGKEPSIEVADGKVSVSAEAVPLSRLLSMWDKAMGTASQVKPELANRPISVQFTDVPLTEATQRMFQGQLLNYIVIAGKGIRVYDVVQGGAATTTVSSSPSYSDYQQPPANNLPANNLFVQPANQSGFVQQPAVTVTGQGQGANPNPNANPNSPQAPVNTLFGARPDPNANQTPTAGTPAIVPGMLPPPVGAANPYTPPQVPVPMPGAPVPTVQPLPGAGALGGVTPGTLK